MQTKMLLVDDHPMLLHGLREALIRQPNLTLLGEASTGAMALKLLRELTPDLVVMDVHLPDASGISTARQMLEFQPSVKIIIFTGDGSRSLVDDALQAGVCGYILKGSVMEVVIQAIDVVMAGKLYLSPEVSAGLLEDHRKSLQEESKPTKPILTERERHLLRLIAEGHRNKEIATSMKLSPNSIETYRARLMKKTLCRSTAEVVRYAIREGIAPL
jgi:DNA-binding NarL/FixJ family response regulator